MFTVQVQGRYDCCTTDEGLMQVLDTKRDLAHWVAVKVRGRGALVEVRNVDTGTLHELHRRWSPSGQYFVCNCEAAFRGIPVCYHRAAALAATR